MNANDFSFYVCTSCKKVFYQKYLLVFDSIKFWKLSIFSIVSGVISFGFSHISVKMFRYKSKSMIGKGLNNNCKIRKCLKIFMLVQWAFLQNYSVNFLYTLGIILTTLLLTNEFVSGTYPAYNYEQTYNLHYGTTSQKGMIFGIKYKKIMEPNSIQSNTQ